MQKIEQATLADEFSDHIEVRLSLLIYTHSHVKHDVWVAQLVKHLNFFDEILEGLSCHVALAKLFHCNFGTHPTRFKDIAIAATSNKISLIVNLKLFEVNVKVKTVFLERTD